MSSTFPVIASILSPEALINDVLPGFEVGAVTECKFFSVGFNDTYRIKISDGSTYYLRAYRETRSINALDVQAIPLFVCARYLWHMGVHTQNSPDWGIGFLND